MSAPSSASKGEGEVKSTRTAKIPWSLDEDNALRDAIQKVGIRRWSVVAAYIPGRTGKQCRERWHNQLDPEISKEPWTHEEEMLLIRAHKQIGNKWVELAKMLPGRTDNSIKNHWNSSLRRKAQKMEEEEAARLAAGSTSNAKKAANANIDDNKHIYSVGTAFSLEQNPAVSTTSSSATAIETKKGRKPNRIKSTVQVSSAATTETEKSYTGRQRRRRKKYGEDDDDDDEDIEEELEEELEDSEEEKKKKRRGRAKQEKQGGGGAAAAAAAAAAPNAGRRRRQGSSPAAAATVAAAAGASSTAAPAASPGEKGKANEASNGDEFESDESEYHENDDELDVEKHHKQQSRVLSNGVRIEEEDEEDEDDEDEDDEDDIINIPALNGPGSGSKRMREGLPSKAGDQADGDATLFPPTAKDQKNNADADPNDLGLTAPDADSILDASGIVNKRRNLQGLSVDVGGTTMEDSLSVVGNGITPFMVPGSSIDPFHPTPFDSSTPAFTAMYKRAGAGTKGGGFAVPGSSRDFIFSPIIAAAAAVEAAAAESAVACPNTPIKQPEPSHKNEALPAPDTHTRADGRPPRPSLQK